MLSYGYRICPMLTYFSLCHANKKGRRGRSHNIYLRELRYYQIVLSLNFPSVQW